MASVSYPRVGPRQLFGGGLVTLIVLGLGTAGAFAGGCNVDTGVEGFEDKDGVNEVPSPNMNNGVGPGLGGSGQGGDGGGIVGQPCISTEDCLDSDLCTIEECVDDKCTQRDAADDGDACTEDTCNGDGVVFNMLIDVDDMKFCTFDECNSTTGAFNTTTLPIFIDDFSDNAAGWSLGPQWQIGAAAPSQMGKANGNDPGDDHSANGDGVAGTVVGGLVMSQASESVLTSPPIVLTSVETTDAVTLRFYRWLNADEPAEMSAFVDVFDCQTDTFVRIWSNADAGVGANAMVLDAPIVGNAKVGGTGWFEVRLDITQAAQRCKLTNEATRVAFGFTKGSSVPSIGGWNIDDVQILRAKVAVDDDICTDDRCVEGAGVPVADNPLLNIMDEDKATTFSCDPDTGPRQTKP